MSVYTTDVLIEGIRRDDVLTWLSDPTHHRAIVEGAFDGCQELGVGHYELDIKGTPRGRKMAYRFERVDDDHGGRRVHVELKGRRVDGHLHYSLRTMKPALNTLVTLHADIPDAGLLTMISEQLGLRKRLDEGFARMLQNLAAAIRS